MKMIMLGTHVVLCVHTGYCASAACALLYMYLHESLVVRDAKTGTTDKDLQEVDAISACCESLCKSEVKVQK